MKREHTRAFLLDTTTESFSDDAKLVWADIETTGLDPAADVELEIGFMVGTMEGLRIGTPFRLFVDHGLEFDEVVNQRLQLARDVDRIHGTDSDEYKSLDLVTRMHYESGLWEDYLEGEKFTRRECKQEFREWLTREVSENEADWKKLQIAGSSVHFDVGFLRAHGWHMMFEKLHHRVLDVSVLKELCRHFNPRIYSLLEEYTAPLKAHRVMPDIGDTIQEYGYYLDNFIWAEETITHE